MTIKSISPITIQQNQTIVIDGKGFGTNDPYVGDSDNIVFSDATGHWDAGYNLDDPADFVTLDVESWTNNRIILGGFAGAWASNNWTLNFGDALSISVTNPQSKQTSSAETYVTSGIDTSSINSIASRADDVAGTYQFVSSYLNPHGVQSLTFDIAQQLSDAGLEIVSLFEKKSMKEADLFEHNGLRNGFRMGMEAYTEAYAAGQGVSPGSAIYFGVEPGPYHDTLGKPKLLAGIADFFKGIAQGFRKAADAQSSGLDLFSIGVYGAPTTDHELMADHLAKYSWFSASSSFAGYHDNQGWDIRQQVTTPSQKLFGVEIDSDQTRNESFGQWRF